MKTWEALIDRWIQLVNYRIPVLFSILSLPLGLLAEMNFRRLPSLPKKIPPREFPSLSIIIPARDESHNLQVILPSLLDIRYPGQLEILVVDDHSSDNTYGIAQSYGVRVLRLDQELPRGWRGKPYACHQGALMANGDWFLFTDADTVHTKSGIARSVCYAEQANLDGFSLFIKNQASSWIHILALDAAFAGLFAGWRDSNSMLNGQFILIHRRAYIDSGGFESVRNEALEDVALGNLLEKLGYRLEIMKGDDIARVHMYDSHKLMFYGLSRLGAGTLRWQGVWAGLTALHVTALVSPLTISLGVLFGKLQWFWFPVAWSTASLSLLPWSRRSGTGKLAILAPLGGLIILVTALFGLVSRIIGTGVFWKGRKV